jgi:hypothetical protein
MKTPLNGLRTAALVAFLPFGLATSGCANSSLEEWETLIPCGGQNYILTSHCRSSSDSLELNACRVGQKLSVGKTSILVPSSSRAVKHPSIFATHWQCVRISTGSYLLLDFTSGSGRGANDEAIEIYDNQLRRVIDEATIRSIYENVDKATEGNVKSIYPEGGN